VNNKIPYVVVQAQCTTILCWASVLLFGSRQH